MSWLCVCRCDLESITESSSRDRHVVMRAAMGQLAMEASEEAAAAAAALAKSTDGAATTTTPTCHMDSVDCLCHAVVGEMLLADADDGYDPESPVTRLVTSASGLALSSLAAKQGGRQGGSDSPVGVCDAAEVWSDLDPDSGGSSPRKGWRRGGSGGGGTSSSGLSVTLARGGNGVSDMEVLLEDADGGREQQQEMQQEEEEAVQLQTPMSGTKRKQTEVQAASPAAWNDAPDALYPHDLWHWQH